MTMSKKGASMYDDTKAIILAAGMSTRLRSAVPKPLLPLKDEKTILDYQIECITRYIPGGNIYIVVGYKKEMIMERYPEFAYVYNQRYAHTNTATSLLAGLDKMSTDTVWLNGDIFFDHRILGRLLRSKTTAVTVDAKDCGDEEVKYTLDGKGAIARLSKEVVGGQGEALGINIVKRRDLAAFKNRLGAAGERDYFEKAIEKMIQSDRVKVMPIPVGAFFCDEIDFEEDLQNVRRYIAKHDR